MSFTTEMQDFTPYVDFAEIHKSASQIAREDYHKKYGIDYHDDPEWEIGNERHTFWLESWDKAHSNKTVRCMNIN